MNEKGIMNYLKQIYYDMRHQKMMTWVSISGTAIAIFLVMVFFMVNSLKTIEMSPETNRNRIYGAFWINLVSTDQTKQFEHTTAMSYPTAKKLYGDLKGVEEVSYTTTGLMKVMVDDKPPLLGTSIIADGNFWKVYDFTFIKGGPFTEEECLGASPLMVITESFARRLLGSVDVVGREVDINGDLHRITGVVKDVSPVFQNTWADAYLSLGVQAREQQSQLQYNPIAGNLKAMLLLAEDTDPESVRKEVESRYATLNSELKKNKVEVIYYGGPFDSESMAIGIPSKGSPDLAKEHRMRYLIYALLILLPAINLSSMMRGRLQHRISEIGLRRAYGARRGDIIAQLFGENFLVTIGGGLIGLILSYLFMMFLSSEVFMISQAWAPGSIDIQLSTPSFSMLFTWQPFIVAIAVCFLLNLLTAGVPAWRAASIEPAEALLKSKN